MEDCFSDVFCLQIKSVQTKVKGKLKMICNFHRFPTMFRNVLGSKFDSPQILTSGPRGSYSSQMLQEYFCKGYLELSAVGLS